MGPFMEGFRTWRDTKPTNTSAVLSCPYDLESLDGKAWLAGVDFGEEHERERASDGFQSDIVPYYIKQERERDEHERERDVPNGPPNTPTKEKTDPEERPGGGGSP